MRSNMPVTNVEYVLKDTETVVSKTDMQGNITYINQDFVNISGFSEEELLGAPQNIVRHPDMPAEAFADFWSTIKSGKAWTGLVKNRCKNGDHYWVEANAAPLIENNKIVGYTSIRIKPTREQVKAADAAYRAIKAGDKGLEIREGNAIRHSLLQRFNLLKNLSIKAKLTLSCGSLVFLFALNGIFAWLATTGGKPQFADWSMAAAGLGTVLAAVFGFMLYRSVVMPLNRTRQDIDRMSAGDLSGKIESSGDDELTRVMQSHQAGH